MLVDKGALDRTSVICKEGSIHAGVFQLQTISQTFATVFLGTLISNIVCIFVWRGSATSKLQSVRTSSHQQVCLKLTMPSCQRRHQQDFGELLDFAGSAVPFLPE